MSTSSPPKVSNSNAQPSSKASGADKTSDEKRSTPTQKKRRLPREIAFKFNTLNLGFSVVEREGGRGLRVRHVTKQLRDAGLSENFIILRLSKYDMRKATMDLWREKIKLCEPPVTVHFARLPSVTGERRENLDNRRGEPEEFISPLFIIVALLLLVLFCTMGEPIFSYLFPSRKPYSRHPMDEWSSSIFDNGGGTAHIPQVEAIGLKVYVSMSDIYLGNSIDFEPGRVQRMCPHCHGTGCKNGDKHHMHTCSKCRGSGVIVQRQQFFGGMVIPMEMECPVCGGRGKVIHKKCEYCDGSGYVFEDRPHKTVIPRGVAEGERLTLKGEGHQAEGYASGDIIVEIHSRPHPVFRRNDLELYAKVDITLLEALTGVDTSLTHLDGRKIPIKISEIVHPRTVITIKNEGMSRGGRKGHLHVSFQIIFPKSVDPTSDLRALLNPDEESPREPVLIKNDKYQDKSEL